MKWLVDFTTTIFFCVGSMPRLVNSSRPVACVRLADQHDVDAAHAHGGAIADRHLGRAEALPGVALQADDLDLGIDRLARGHGDLAAEAQADLRAQPGIEADAHGDRIPDRAEAGILDLAVDQVAQDVGIVRRRAAAGIVGRIGDHHRQVVEGDALADAGRSTSNDGGWVLPRSATSSSPSLVASASAFFLSPSAITSTRVPISATSP